MATLPAARGFMFFHLGVRAIALAAEIRANRYREVADKLWRFSLDQRLNISFESRPRLAAMAEEFETRALQLGRKIAADYLAAPGKRNLVALRSFQFLRARVEIWGSLYGHRVLDLSGRALAAMDRPAR